MSRFSFAERAGYDNELVETLFGSLPRDYSSKNRARLVAKHRNYPRTCAAAISFERRDIGWKEMLPYGSIGPFLDAIEQAGAKSADEVTAILRAIKPGRRLERSRRGRATSWRCVSARWIKALIRSYRLFDGDHFTPAPSRKRRLIFFSSARLRRWCCFTTPGDGQEGQSAHQSRHP